MKILCVDYDINSLRVIKNVFEFWGFSVTGCNNINQIAKCLQESDFDAIITEINLPGTAPGELVGMMHKYQKETPIIVLTECHSIKSTVKAIRDGAYEVLQKPVVPDNLLDLVLKAVRVSQASCVVHETSGSGSNYHH